MGILQIYKDLNYFNNVTLIFTVVPSMLDYILVEHGSNFAWPSRVVASGLKDRQRSIFR